MGVVVKSNKVAVKSSFGANASLAEIDVHVVAKALVDFEWTGCLDTKGMYPVNRAWCLSNDELSINNHLDPCDLAPFVLVRGLPGSGKSTLAKALERRGYMHIEADQYFYKRGRYIFEAKLMPEAHKWCLDLTKRTLRVGKPVVVSNTFLRASEMAPYIKFAGLISILEMKGNWQNVHGVSDKAIEKMKTAWEQLA